MQEVASGFQSTHPRGVRLVLVGTLNNSFLFQSTHPRGVRRFGTLAIGHKLRFNPRTHEGCDITINSDKQWQAVSIHAPTRGATRLGMSLRFIKKFQSTHPRGVRLRTDKTFSRKKCFNPRTHEGCDYVYAHTYLIYKSFNPRTHEGCDATEQKEERTEQKFQSTHPRGVRLFNQAIVKVTQESFNPRTHEGCDKTSVSYAN